MTPGLQIPLELAGRSRDLDPPNELVAAAMSCDGGELVHVDRRDRLFMAARAVLGLELAPAWHALAEASVAWCGANADRKWSRPAELSRLVRAALDAGVPETLLARKVN